MILPAAQHGNFFTLQMTAMDNENTLLVRLKFLAVAGVGFFADGYLNLSIGLGMCFQSINTAYVR